MSHALRAGIIPESQFGFWRSYSSETALMNVADYIVTGLDQNKFVLFVVLDFSKAFDMTCCWQYLHHVGLECWVAIFAIEDNLCGMAVKCLGPDFLCMVCLKGPYGAFLVYYLHVCDCGWHSTLSVSVLR